MNERKLIISSIRSHLLYIVCILLLIFVSTSKLFHPLFFTTHDGGGHVIRMIAFDEAIRDGQFPVRLAKNLYNGLSYPFFNFSYPLVYYLAEAVHLLGVSFVTTFKTLMFFSVFFGAIGMYMFLLRFFDKKSAFLGALFYTLAPYRFLNMYVRGNVAESIGLALVPFAFLALEYFVRSGRFKSVVLVFVYTLVLLGHNITALINAIVSSGYLLFRTWESKKRFVFMLRQLLIPAVLVLGITAFFWIPVVIESKDTKLIELTEDFREFFPRTHEVLYSPWGFGGFAQGDVPGKMSPQVGLGHTAVMGAGVLYMLYLVLFQKKRSEQDNIFLFFLGLTLVSFFLATPLSRFLWERVYVLKLMQQPFRFVGFMTFGISVMAGYFLSRITHKYLKILGIFGAVAFLFYANRNHIRVNMYIPFEHEYSTDEFYGPSTTSKDEHMPKLADRVYGEIPDRDGVVFPEGAGESTATSWRSNYHSFRVIMNRDGSLRNNTLYFPGWVAEVDGERVPIQYKTDGLYRLRVYVPEGEHTVEFFFKETWYRKLANTMSVGFFVIFVIYLIKYYRKISL